MRFLNIRLVVVLSVFSMCWNAHSQDKVQREVTVHKNVKLIVMTPDADLSEDIQRSFTDFVPLFEEVLKASTADETDACALTIRLTAAMKEIGSAKTPRPQARVSAIRRDSRQEFIATFLLYSYISAGPVNREEIEQFVKKQVLDPVQCEPAD